MNIYYSWLLAILFLLAPTTRIDSMIEKSTIFNKQKSFGFFANKKNFYQLEYLNNSTSDDEENTASYTASHNSEKPKGGKLRGGNPDEVDKPENNKQFLTSIFGGFFCGLTCGAVEGYLATDPLEVIDNLECNLLQEHPPRSLNEALTIHKWVQRGKQVAPIPLTWSTFWLLRRQLIHKYPNDLKWLSFFTSCFGYIVGRISLAYVNGSRLSAEKNFELNIPSVGKIKTSGSFSLK